MEEILSQIKNHTLSFDELNQLSDAIEQEYHYRHNAFIVSPQSELLTCDAYYCYFHLENTHGVDIYVCERLKRKYCAFCLEIQRPLRGR